jgi:hypothetical protein
MLLAITLGAAVLGAHPAAPAPRLTVVDLAPVAVRGARFHARERVRVRLRAPGTHASRRVRAGRRGRFTATFPSATVDRCTRFRIRAAGARGSRAVLVHLPLPACPPA